MRKIFDKILNCLTLIVVGGVAVTLFLALPIASFMFLIVKL